MCLPGAERVILSSSEGPQQCPSLPCGLKFFSPPSILLFLAPAGYTFPESALKPYENTTHHQFASPIIPNPELTPRIFSLRFITKGKTQCVHGSWTLTMELKNCGRMKFPTPNLVPDRCSSR